MYVYVGRTWLINFWSLGPTAIVVYKHFASMIAGKECNLFVALGVTQGDGVSSMYT